MRLHHYTNAQNALQILRAGEIISGLEKATRGDNQRSILVPEVDDLIDGMVWLTTERKARQSWQAGDFKHNIRFTVEAEVETWLDYADRVEIPAWYRDMLAFRGCKPETWYVTPGPVPQDDWVKLGVTDHETVIWRRGDFISEALPPLDLADRREQAELRARLGLAPA